MLIQSEFFKYVKKNYKIVVFQGVFQYFGLIVVYSVAITLHMTIFNNKTQKKLCEKGEEAFQAGTAENVSLS